MRGIYMEGDTSHRGTKRQLRGELTEGLVEGLIAVPIDRQTGGLSVSPMNGH